MGIHLVFGTVECTEFPAFSETPSQCVLKYIETLCVQRRLAERVTTSQVSWNSIKKAWAREAFFRAVDEAAAETLFTRHVAKLQQDEAADARQRAADVRLPRIFLPTLFTTEKASMEQQALKTDQARNLNARPYLCGTS